MKGFKLKFFLIQFLLLLPSSLLFGQKQLLFIDGDNKVPISGLTVRFTGGLKQTDNLGQAIIPDTILRIIVSGKNYALVKYQTPFPDSIMVFRKAIEYVPVPIESVLNKVKKNKRRSEGRNYGAVFTNRAHFQRFKINQLGTDSAALRFFVSSKKIQALPSEAMVRIEFRTVNQNWIDTTWLIPYLNDFQLKLIKLLEKECFYAPNELVFRKDIPKSEVTSNLIDIPIDSLAGIYEELFITIGLTNVEKVKLNAKRAFEAKNCDIAKTGIHFYRPTEGFIPIWFFYIMNQDYDQSETLSTPYFELVSTRKSK